MSTTPTAAGQAHGEKDFIFDDTIEEKPHTDENEIVSWHFDHSKNRTLHQHPQLRLPRSGYDAAGGNEIIRPRGFKRRGEVSKNELMRRMLKVFRNRLEYRYFWQTAGFRKRI